MKFIKRNWFIVFLFLFAIICFVCLYRDLSHRLAETDKSMQEWERSQKEWQEYQTKYNTGMKAANAQVLKEGLDYEEIADVDRYLKSIGKNNSSLK